MDLPETSPAGLAESSAPAAGGPRVRDFSGKGPDGLAREPAKSPYKRGTTAIFSRWRRNPPALLVVEWGQAVRRDREAASRPPHRTRKDRT